MWGTILRQMPDPSDQCQAELQALSPEARAALAAQLAEGTGLKLIPKQTTDTSKDIGHFDLLFTVLYATIVIDVFHTIAKSPLPSFPFLLAVTLLIIVIDHWLMHYRNREQIDQHRYFSLVTIGLTLFFYAKANEILSGTSAPGEEASSFWRWIIFMFCTSFVMKHYYPDKWFHRIWDFIAVGACFIYLVGIHYWQWTNGLALGAASLCLAISYLPFEVRHYKHR
jgi:hypothetical protein